MHFFHVMSVYLVYLTVCAYIFVSSFEYMMTFPSRFADVSLLLSLYLFSAYPSPSQLLSSFFLPITVTVPTATVGLYEVGQARQLQGYC